MRMLLNDDWKITWEPLSREAADAFHVRNKSKDWLDANLPCDIHMPLIKYNIIAEPLHADNCFSSEWTEKRSWWFSKHFKINAEQIASERIEITFEALDAEADVWLNDTFLGHHRSAFYPFTREVKNLIHEGENRLLVRVTSGLERYSEQDISLTRESVVPLTGNVIGVRGDERRVMVRKPQYVYGWDWGPRIATCGIVGDVRLDFSQGLRFRNAHAVTLSVDTGGNGAAQVSLQIELENLHPFRTMETSLKVELLYGSQLAVSTEAEHYLRSGINYIKLRMEVPDAKLWWPNGMGDQPLYTVRASAQSSSQRVDLPSFQFGIRTLRLNMEKLTDGNANANANANASENDKEKEKENESAILCEDVERRFAFEINGVPIFCKGANWIPADSIYARLTNESYETLLQEAKEANFNMLRIWGGGIYERDIFYEKCDEYGILVWQDFMFACAKYPDHLAWFREEVEREIDYQTLRLRNHCSLALWCGNNEVQWAFDEGWNETDAVDFFGGAICYNDIAPRIVERNCPEIPYWNGSPYGGTRPNGSVSGDRHHWHDCTMNEQMEKRITPEEYDKITAKFVSEYGYIGPCRKSSIEAYHQGLPLDRTSKVWQLHNNTFEKDTVLAGIDKHYVPSENLNIDDYLLYAGLCQGLMYGYSLESMLSKPFCSGALFWMYNDCWGEVGWSIIDYYLTRKISYYFVKRAFEPVKLILRHQNGTVTLTAINETSSTITETIAYGQSRYDAVEEDKQPIQLFHAVIPPSYRGTILEWKANEYDPHQAFQYAKSVSDLPSFKPAVLRAASFRDLMIPSALLTLSNIQDKGDCLSFSVTSDVFAHAVHFGLDERIQFSDEYFDLLPGEQRTISMRKPKPSESFSTDCLIPKCINQ
ncbi:glycoside hydrolase family 2 protein [Paenibacillus eucommiae]|uniref:beta-mannosidase n=1 Tax=Paenibacillus eucommiae TaxID=1355755 RepID=A0ABS4J401_9BACL|nr:sugar-binding domain-containing protein [Paenibacillus eucommiae]MBP1994548.1 beta-mannosidase [Paenibacillus eucommiae]